MNDNHTLVPGQADAITKSKLRNYWISENVLNLQPPTISMLSSTSLGSHGILLSGGTHLQAFWP